MVDELLFLSDYIDRKFLKKFSIYIIVNSSNQKLTVRRQLFCQIGQTYLKYKNP